MTFLFSMALYSVLLVPFLAGLIIYALPRHKERLPSLVATGSVLIIGIGTVLLILSWFYRQFEAFEYYLTDLHIGPEASFPITFLVDGKGTTFLSITSFLGALTIKYSRYYLHREKGYCRFFSTIFMFIFGMNLLILSGTLELFFAGWEVVGISSFLLIGFYRGRINPVQNALWVYYIYRLCDVGLLLAAWLGSLVFHTSFRFISLNALTLNGVAESSLLIALMSFLLLLAAIGKSAQFPFCFWLPRAMEGPTPSSAIFYGGLSIHAGVFLLLRTEAVWFSVPAARVVMAFIGVLSAFLSTLIGRTQSNIKGQIAYSSIAQVGLMLVELSFGFFSLALFHMVANACLRSYQLLISPSVVAQLLRVQGASDPNTSLSDWSFERRLPSKVRSTFYVLSLNEGYLVALLNLILWRPIFFMGNILHKLNLRVGRWGVAVVAFILILTLMFGSQAAQDLVIKVLISLSLIVSIFIFSERKNAFDIWNGASLSSLLIAIAICGVKSISYELWIYASGILPCWILGSIAIHKLLPGEREFELYSFHGRVDRNPTMALLLFLSFIGLVGFPITPAFFGNDMLLSHASKGHIWMSSVIAITFVMNGVVLVRLFSHLCLGPKRSPISISN